MRKLDFPHFLCQSRRASSLFQLSDTDNNSLHFAAVIQGARLEVLYIKFKERADNLNSNFKAHLKREGGDDNTFSPGDDLYPHLAS